MVKTIGLIAEDDSDIEVISEILSKYMDKHTFSIKKFTGDGCGKLKQKCAIWAKLLFKRGCDHVLLFHDLDRNNEKALRQALLVKIPPASFPNSLIVIPVEELEAWLLSDSDAIKKVFGLPKAPNKIAECELIQSPKEHLGKIVWQIGKKRYLNTVHNKKISTHASLKNFRRCSSFKTFDEYVTQNICA